MVTSAPSTDGFAQMTFLSVREEGGETQRLRGSFDVARVIEPAETPGWESDTWEGQPIGARD